MCRFLDAKKAAYLPAREMITRLCVAEPRCRKRRLYKFRSVQ